MTGIDRLIEDVEAGADEIHMFPALPNIEDRNNFVAAYNGSLDAAKRLHDALLPGWAWRVEDNGSATAYKGDAMRDQKLFDAEADNSARAWLLAILKAYRSTQ